MEVNKFDLKGFLNSSEAQANKPAAIKYLQSKGIIDAQGNPIASAIAPTIEPAAPGGIWGMVKSLVSAPLTMIARPFQAASELGSYLGTQLSLKGKTPSEQAAILAQEADRAKKTQTESSFGGFVAPIPADISGVKKDVGRAIQTVALGLEAPAAVGAAIGAGTSLEQGNDLFSVQTALQTALGAGAGKVLALVGKPIFNVAGKVIGEITPVFLKELVAKGDQAIMDFAAQHNILPEGIKKTVGAIGEKIGSVVDTTKSAITNEYKGSAIDTTISGIKNKAAGIFEGKTQAEILATPESQIYKLSPSERSYYYSAHTSAITERSAQIEAQIKQDLVQKTTALQTEADTLNRQLAVASRDEVVALRPKIREALGKQSQEYRRLVDEEIAPHKDIPITAQEVNSFIDTKFSEDPAKALAIKNKLGITDTTNPTAEATIGQMYEKAKTLGQDISSSVKKGTRVYTPDEKLIDDSIHTITDIIKSKGVDLSASRSFWARYAPIRNQLVSEAKPFLQAPVQTKIFAGTLTRVAKGADVNNENFIKEVENILGTKIGSNTKKAVAALTANEKQAIANETAAQIAKAEEKLAKDQALKNWDAKQFEIERLAAHRAAIINAIKIVGAIAGYAEVRHVIPFLP